MIRSEDDRGARPPSARAMERLEWQLQQARREEEIAGQELAALGLDGPPEEPPWPVAIAVLFGFSVGFTMALAFYDLVFAQMLPQNAALVAGMVAGALVCLPVVVGMVESAVRPSGPLTNLWWILVSLGLSYALVLMRLAQAETEADRQLAYGMALLELMLLLVLKIVCSGIAKRHERYRAESAAYWACVGLRETARRKYEWLALQVPGHAVPAGWHEDDLHEPQTLNHRLRDRPRVAGRVDS